MPKAKRKLRNLAPKDAQKGTAEKSMKRRNLKRTKPTNSNHQDQHLTGSKPEKTKRLEGGKPLNVDLIKTGEFSVKTPKDETDCFITGADITPDGRILLVYYHNRNLKRFSKEKTYVDSLRLPHSHHFYGISVLNDEEAIVSVRWDQYPLYVIGIKDKRFVKNKIQFDCNWLRGVASCNDKLILCCWCGGEDEPNCVQLIDTNGVIYWSNSHDYNTQVIYCRDGKPNINKQVVKRFISPAFPTCFMENDRKMVVVSDEMNNTITKLNTQLGEIENSRTFISNMKRDKQRLPKVPSGMTTDINGNIYVCYSTYSTGIDVPEVIVWTSDLEHHKIVLSATEGLDSEPYLIKYHGACNEFLISYHSRSESRNFINCLQFV